MLDADVVVVCGKFFHGPQQQQEWEHQQHRQQHQERQQHLLQQEHLLHPRLHPHNEQEDDSAACEDCLG